jgi:N-methylhydantoinase A
MSAAARRKVSLREAAQGVLRVVSVNMERALRAISVERGFDPRDFALIPFGGAGGLHACELARALRIPRVIVPTSAGALSALGALSSDVVKDWSRTVMLEATDANHKLVEHAFREMEREARSALKREGFSREQQRHERLLAVRYRGQSFELEIPLTRGTKISAAFHQAHQERYGYAQPSQTVEVVSARLRSLGLVKKLKVRRAQRIARAQGLAAPQRYLTAYLSNGRTRAAIYSREELAAGARLRTPCIVTEYSATTLIPADARALVDADGNLIIEL